VMHRVIDALIKGMRETRLAINAFKTDLQGDVQTSLSVTFAGRLTPHRYT